MVTTRNQYTPKRGQSGSLVGNLSDTYFPKWNDPLGQLEDSVLRQSEGELYAGGIINTVGIRTGNLLTIPTDPNPVLSSGEWALVMTSAGFTGELPSSSVGKISDLEDVQLTPELSSDFTVTQNDHGIVWDDNVGAFVNKKLSLDGHIHDDRYYTEIESNARFQARSAIVSSSAFTGFVDPSGITVTYDHTSRTITLTGDLKYFWKGTEYTLTSPWTSTAHTATEGSWFLYSTDGITFQWSQTTWEFSHIMVAHVRYSATPTLTLATREVHGTMDWNAHQILHNQIGTHRISGGTPKAGTFVENTQTNAAITPGFNQAVIRDEDCDTIIPELVEGSYTLLSVGAGETSTFTLGAAYPFTTGTSFIRWNNTTTGTFVEGSTQKFYNVYQILLPAAADTNSQAYRTLFLQPQREFDSLQAAQSEDIRTLNVGGLSYLSPEFVFFTRITYSTNASYSTQGRVIIPIGGLSYVVGSRASQSYISGFSSNAHNVLSNLSWTQSGHYGGLGTLAGFNSTTGAASEYGVSSLNEASKVVQRDTSGNFSASVISMSENINTRLRIPQTAPTGGTAGEWYLTMTSSGYSGELPSGSGAQYLGELEDVDLTLTPLDTNQALIYNGTDWINSALSISQITNLSTELLNRYTKTQSDARYPVLVSGSIPSGYLPSYVDDIIEVATFSALPVTGESGKIYVTLDTNLTYRWGGTEYTEVSKSLALGESPETAYWGDKGKIAFDHSQITSGNPHGVSYSNILGTVPFYTKGESDLRYHPMSGSSDISFTAKKLKSSTLVIPTGPADLVAGEWGLVMTGAGFTGELPSSGEGAGVLNDLDDVSVVTPAINQILQYNGTTWINALLSSSQVITALGYTPQAKLIGTQNTSNGSLVRTNTAGTIYYDNNSYALTSSLHNAVTLGTANGLSLSTQELSLGLASTTTNGALSSTDWNTFNGKAAGDHNHDLTYLGITAKAADSDKLDGNDSTYFATATQLNAANLTSGYLPHWNGSSLVNSNIINTTNGVQIPSGAYRGTWSYSYPSGMTLSAEGTNISIEAGWNSWITLSTGASGYENGLVYIPYGKLGIGYTDRSEKLAVAGSGFFADSLNATAIGSSYYGLQVTGSAGGARRIFLAGQYGFSNGFTVRYDGTTMKYNFANGGVGIGMDDSGYGLAVAGSGYFDTTLEVAGVTSLTNTTQSTAYTNGALVLSGGLGIAKDLFSNGNATFVGRVKSGTLIIPTGTTNLVAGEWGLVMTGAGFTGELPGEGGATSLDGLSDVTLGTLATSQILTYNGTVWVNALLSSNQVVTALGYTPQTKLIGTQDTSNGSLVRTNTAGTIYYDNNSYALASTLTSHTGNTSNPHSVTAAQVSAVALSGTPLTTGLDLNTLTNVGSWFTTSTAIDNSLVNRPTAGAGESYVTNRLANGLLEQIFTELNGYEKFVRAYRGTWSAWYKFYHSGNLLNIGTTALSAREALGLGSMATETASNYSLTSHTHSYITSTRYDSGDPKPNQLTVGLSFQFSYPDGGWYNAINMRSYNDPNYLATQIVSCADNPGSDTGYSFSLKYREGRNATWLGWKTILDSSNYSSYALPLSGGILSNSIKFGYSSGTMIHSNSFADMIGWNPNYGTYIGTNVSGLNRYIYADGTFNVGGTLYNLIHSGNIGSQSVNYATSAGTSVLLDGYGIGAFLRKGNINTDYWNQGNTWVADWHGTLPDGLSGVYNYGTGITINGSTASLQFYAPEQSEGRSGDLWYRTGWQATKRGWIKVIHSENIGQQSVNYSTTARFLDTVSQNEDSIVNYDTNAWHNWAQFSTPLPGDYKYGLHIGSPDANYNLQVGMSAGSTSVYLRTKNGSYNTWQKIWTDGNLTNTLANGYLPYWNVSTGRLENSAIIQKTDGSGNVGVSNSNPQRRLHINSSSSPALRLESVGSNQGIEMLTHTSKYSWLLGAQYNIDGGFEITPSTEVGGTTFSTPVAVFKANGNVGIGTTNPASYSNIVALTIGDNSSTKQGLLKFRSSYNSGDGAELWLNNSGLFTHNINSSTNAYTIQSNGNFGIGYNDRPEKLAVAGTVWARDGIKFSNGGGGSAIIYGSDTDGLLRISNNNIYTGDILFQSQNITQFALRQGGNIDIGWASNPNLGYKLSVNGSGYFSSDLTVNGQGSFNSVNVATSAGITLREAGYGYWNIRTVYEWSNPDLIFLANGTRRFRVSAAGNFDIGYTDGFNNNVYKLNVNGSGYFNGFLTVAGQVYIQSDLSVLRPDGTDWIKVLYRNGGSPYIDNLLYLKATSIKIGANWEAIPNGSNELEFKYGTGMVAKIGTSGAITTPTLILNGHSLTIV